MPSTPSVSRNRVIGVYTSVFLTPEDAWVYEAVSRIDGLEVHVFYDSLQDISRYPFQNIHCVFPAEPDPPAISFASLWPFSRKAPVEKKGGIKPGALLAEEVSFWGIKALHVLSGLVAFNAWPVFQAFNIPMVTSFDEKTLAALASQEADIETYQTFWRQFRLMGCMSSSVTQGLKDLGCPPEKLYPLYLSERHQTSSSPPCLEAFYRQILKDV